MCHVSYDHTSLLEVLSPAGRVAVYSDCAGREFSVPVVCQLKLGRDRIKTGRLEGIEVKIVTVDAGFDGVAYAEDCANFVEIR